MDTTLEDKTKELLEESRMVLVQFIIDRVSLGVHSMGEALTFLVAVRILRWSVMQQPCTSTKNPFFSVLHWASLFEANGQ